MELLNILSGENNTITTALFRANLTYIFKASNFIIVHGAVKHSVRENNTNNCAFQGKFNIYF